MDRGLSFTVLGPLTARRDGVALDLGSPQQRALLAALLLREGAQVTLDELAGVVWGETVPASVAATIRTYVYRLRQVLGDGVIRSAPGGYVLPLEPGELDLAVFRRTAESDRAAALRLFQGTPLAGIPGPYAERQRDALERLRVSTADALVEQELDAGGHARIVGELAGLIADRPLDEHLREMFMVALYRCGRQADALSAYHEGRRLLADELGIDPGPGLQALHERILRGDRDLLATTVTPTVAMAQLPPDLGAFAGREKQLDAAMNLQAGTGPVIGLVIGTAGVGKTTFAVHWAHRAAGRYPDGQIYVNLHGFDPAREPTPPGDAIRVVLQSLGVDATQLPAHPDAQQALYLSTIADRRLVLLLDNARDARQVRPLLAGSPSSLIIVTGRAQLGGLVAGHGAHPIHLDVFGDDDARELLERRLGAPRVADEPDAVQEIVEYCARLPLALALVAARAATRPAFRLSDIATELRRDRLDALESDDPETDARSVFSWSYQALNESTARLFRLLALHPGPDITVSAAAALAGRTVREARRGLTELADAVLLEERRPGRYSWHDLLRAYADEINADTDTHEERQAARERLFDHLVESTRNAAKAFNPYRPRHSPPLPTAGIAVAEPADAVEAVEWTAAEQPVLVAAVAAAAAAGFGRHAWHLARELEAFQLRAGFWQEMAVVHRIALECARADGDTLGAADSRHSLARSYAGLGDYDTACAEAAEAVAAYRASGHRRGEAVSLATLGEASERLGRFSEARTFFEESVALLRTIGEPYGLATVANNLAMLLVHTGDVDEAEPLAREALEAIPPDDQFEVASGRDTLGFVYLRQGRPDKAIPLLRAAADSCEELAMPFHLAEVLEHLGQAYAAAEDIAGARDAWQRADEFLAGFVGTPAGAEMRERIRGLLTSLFP